MKGKRKRGKKKEEKAKRIQTEWKTEKRAKASQAETHKRISENLNQLS